MGKLYECFVLDGHNQISYLYFSYAIELIERPILCLFKASLILELA